MAETSKSLRVQRASGIWNEETVKVYTTQQEIAGEDAGVRIQMDEGICFIPCVDISHKRASSAKVQTSAGIKALATRRRFDLNNIAGIKLRYQDIQLQDGKTSPTYSTLTIWGLPTMRVFANSSQGGWIIFRADLLDSQGNVIDEVWLPDEDYSLEFNVTNVTSLRGCNNSYGFMIGNHHFDHGYAGKYFIKNDSVSVSVTEAYGSRRFMISVSATGGHSATVETRIRSIVLKHGSFSKNLPVSF